MIKIVKKYLLLILTILLLVTLTTAYSVNSDDSNMTSVVKKESKIVNEDNSVVKTGIKKKESVNKETNLKSNSEDDVIDEDCSSSIIHASNNEGAISFRRDNSATVTIKVGTNGSLVKQYKTSGSYFVHMMASSNGWMIGSGGLDGEKSVRNVERETLNMIKSDQYSQSSVNKLLSYKKASSLAHLSVKSPDGHYFVYQNYYGKKYQTSGILKPGEFLSVPNNPVFFKKGNYVSYTGTSDVMTASRIICAKDKYGSKRRNIITFHYKNNGFTSTINVTAANDNGKYVGLNSAGYVDNIQTTDKYIPASQVPKLDNFVHLKTYTFQLRKATSKINVEDIKLNDASMTLKAHVTDELGKNVNAGRVSFSVNGKPVLNSKGERAYVNVVNGEAILKHYDPMVLKYRVSNLYAFYDGTSDITPSGAGARILNDIPQVRMNVNSTASLGKIIRITASITYVDKQKVNDGTAVIKFNSKTLTKANGEVVRFNIKNGKIDYSYRLPLNFPQGNVNVEIEYTSPQNHKKVAGSLINVTKISPRIDFVTLVANPKLLKVRAKLVDDAKNKVRINSNVLLKINGNVIRSGNYGNVFYIVNGILTINYDLYSQFKKGTYKLTVEYAGDKYTNRFTQEEVLRIL